ncbi:MAG: SPOR domain-containing protein [Tidjanibacter sp.]|nr:SPOR domain-containing protein [Tidjanibacter sp.]
MKKLIFALLATTLATVVGAQNIANFKAQLSQPDSLTSARVVATEEWGSAADAIMKFDAQTSPQESFQGYRIRIYSGNSQSARAEAEAARQLFVENYNVPAYFAYENPYFLVSCGNCLTQEEAIMLLSKVKIHFPKAFVVMAEIPASAVTTTYVRPVVESTEESTEEEGEKSAEGEAVVAEEQTAAAII